MPGSASRSCAWGARKAARATYERGIGQAEKFGHGGMADDLRLAILQLNA